MIYYKLLFTFLLSLSIFYVNHSLKIEKIIGAYTGLQSDFKYQAAIVAKYNYTHTSYLVCSAGIIYKYLLISAARCFVHKLNQLKKLRFFAVVGVNILVVNDAKLLEIETIYTYYYSSLAHINDLAVIKLARHLNLQNDMDYNSFLKIPLKHENFLGQKGIVSGFGINMINDIDKYRNRERIQLRANSFLNLKYANVTLIGDGRIDVLYNHTSSVEKICGQTIRDFTEICGVILPDERYEHRGVCMGDIGAPLLVGDTIVGIVSKHNVDCDDTVEGTVYTKLSNYVDFINSIKAGEPTGGTRYYMNPPHITYRKATRVGTSKD